MKPESWFERFAFEENPLTIKPNDELVGRDELALKLLDSVKAGSMVALIGEYGHGKTSMLKHIVKRYKGKRKVIYFSANRLTAPLQLDTIMYERYGVVGKLFQIKSKNLILLLDEVEHLTPQDFAHVQEYFANGYFLSVILVTNESECIPQTLEAKRILLDALSSKDAVSLIQKRLDNAPILSETVIKKIYDVDKRIRKFLQNTERVIKYKVEHDVAIRPSDVAKILTKPASE